MRRPLGSLWPLARFAAVAVSLAWEVPSAAQGVGTAFNYQGRLVNAGVPANGFYDLKFDLYGHPTAPTPLVGSLTLSIVSVSSGLFNVSLDFGAVFTGEGRWLEISARPAGGGAFTALTPRQELTPTPHAILSQSAPWAGISGKPLDLVTSVVSGGGITGSVVSNALTLGSDSTVQRRTAGSPLSCSSGQYLRSVAADGTPTCIAEAIGWGLGGNAGTAPGTQFLGTTDLQPLDLRVNNARVLRLQPGTNSPSVVGGFSGNSAAGVDGAVIAGGGFAGAPNTVTAHWGTVGGGAFNTASQMYATVSGGELNTAGQGHATVGGGFNNTASTMRATVGGGAQNTASGTHATVGGGNANSASGSYTTVGGGQNNTASGEWATVAGGVGNSATNTFRPTVGGGESNTASGGYSTVPGGYANHAGGDFSFAAGRQAKVRNEAMGGGADGDEGSFVWADSQAADFTSTGPNQFLIRSAGGVGINTSTPVAGSALSVSGNTSVTGSVGIGAAAPSALKLHVAGGSVFIAQPNSLILTSPNGNCWFLTVSDTGALSTFQVACP